MHYKNGRAAKVGDPVMGFDSTGKPVSGVLVDAIPGTDTCNGCVVPQTVINNAVYYTLGDFCHADDVVLPEKAEASA